MDLRDLDRRLRAPVRPRHAGRLRARARGRACGALDRHLARGGDASRSPTAPTTSRCSRSLLHPRRRHHGGGRDFVERVGEPRQGLRRLHPRRPRLVNILASAFFGCISGSSVADTASIGTVMVPQMEKNGYPRLFAVSVTRGLAQPLPDPALPQRRNLFARRRRHDLDRRSVPRRRHPGQRSDGVVLVIARRARLPEGRADSAAPGSSDHRRGFLGGCSRWSSSSAASSAASSRPPSPRRSPASTPSWSRCSSTATTNGAKFRSWSRGVVRTVGIVMIMIGFSVAFGYMMALMQVPAKRRSSSRWPTTSTSCCF